LDAENWYFVTHNAITKAGGRGILKYYNGSHIKALMKLYPELKLNKESFYLSKADKHNKNVPEQEGLKKMQKALVTSKKK